MIITWNITIHRLFHVLKKAKITRANRLLAKGDRQSMYNVINYCPLSHYRNLLFEENSCNCGKHVLYIIFEAATRKRKPGTRDRDIDFARLFIPAGR